MFISLRKTKKGTYFSFSYDDPETGKRIRLKKHQHPTFTDEASARQWAKSQDALRESQKNRVLQKLAWKKEFYEFDALVAKFTEYQKNQAPNSWENAVYYLEQYALDWFLNIKKQNNINGWHFLFNEYRLWLSTEAKILAGSKPSYSTCNKAIHALNSFVSFLAQSGLIDPDVAARKCPAYPEAMLNQKSFDSVINENEFLTIYTRLKDKDPPSADFWWVLYHSGLRFNELLSLPMSFLYRGETDGALHSELKQLNISYLGYLVLESQSEDKYRTREEDGTIKRKPLKGRTKIHPKNNRVVPITNRDCWNILARRYKLQKAIFDEKTHGGDQINYMLFQDVNYSKVKRALDTAYKGTSFTPKTFHDCRHSYCTFLVGNTRSFFLARTILGHKSNAFERYLHIFEQMSLRAKQNEQVIEEI
jgi:integrase